LEAWFEDEPVGVPVQLTTTGLSEALPAILAALGERLPDDLQPMQEGEAHPVEALRLELRDPHLYWLVGAAVGAVARWAQLSVSGPARRAGAPPLAESLRAAAFGVVPRERHLLG